MTNFIFMHIVKACDDVVCYVVLLHYFPVHYFFESFCTNCSCPVFDLGLCLSGLGLGLGLEMSDLDNDTAVFCQVSCILLVLLRLSTAAAVV